MSFSFQDFLSFSSFCSQFCCLCWCSIRTTCCRLQALYYVGDESSAKFEETSLTMNIYVNTKDVWKRRRCKMSLQPASNTQRIWAVTRNFLLFLWKFSRPNCRPRKREHSTKKFGRKRGGEKKNTTDRTRWETHKEETDRLHLQSYFMYFMWVFFVYQRMYQRGTDLWDEK